MKIYRVLSRMRLILFAILLSVMGQINAQNSLSPGFDAFSPISFHINPFNHTDDEILNEIYVNYGLDYGSNHLTPDFIKAVLLKQFIGSAIKDPAAATLKGQNNTGANSGWETSYAHMFKDKAGLWSRILFSVAKKQFLSADYSDDIFRLIFYGNSGMSGQQALISPFNYLFLDYYQVKAAYLKALNPSLGPLEISGGLALNFGQDYQHIDIENGYLFTAADGTFVDLDWVMQSFHSEVLEGRLMNGFGPSLDFGLDLKASGMWHVALQDLGLMNWFNHAIAYKADTSIHWEGLEVNNPFTSGSIGINVANLDSAINLAGGHKSIGSKTILLPWQLNATYKNDIGSNGFSLLGGISYIHLPAYQPMYYLIGNQSFLNGKMAAEISLSYGGFRRFDTGLRVAFSDKKQFQIAMGSNSISSFLLPGYFQSGSAFISVGYAF